MTWFAGLTASELEIIGLVVAFGVLGAVIGGAWGYWRGGSSRIVRGAIAGGVAGTIAGVELVLFAGGIAIVALIVGASIVLGGAF